MKYTTMIELVEERNANQGEKQAYLWLENGERETDSLTYKQLTEKAKAIALHLTSICQPQERVLLIYPPGLEYIQAFYGCLLAGVIAVPVYPPRKSAKHSHLQAIIKDAQPKAILTDSSLSYLENISPCIYTDKIDINQGNNWVKPDINSETIALLQYTSGSTGNPKGVIITHSNLLHNQAIIKKTFGYNENTVGVSWLPLVHDMGLISNVLQPIYLGRPLVLMSPLAFLQKPLRWLEAITKYQATISGGPNFAYDLCIKKITPQQRENLDLSQWSVAFIGAEPIKAATIKEFGETFQNCGFRGESFSPCYGMAEATLMITGKAEKTAPVIKERVGCGVKQLDTQIVIVQPETLTPCQEGEEGEILVAGKSVSPGYWQKPDLNATTFVNLPPQSSQRFLRTGDLGYLEEGELFVTGRLKDLIIIRGRNYYPQDIEEIVENAHSSLTANASAAFEIEVEGETKLVVVVEVKRSERQKIVVEEVIETIKQAIAEELEIGIYAIVLLQPASLPQTFSGKVQRYQSCQAFLAGSLKVIGEWREIEIDSHPILFDSTTEEGIQNWLITRLALAMQVDADNIDINKSFADYGLDSMVTLDISNELAEWLGCELRPSFFWEYPNIEAVSQYLITLND
jgi:phthiocerol/phenolphthiocerol synthesis type-I polyketide synthase C